MVIGEDVEIGQPHKYFSIHREKMLNKNLKIFI